jgi:hypothetical protein
MARQRTERPPTRMTSQEKLRDQLRVQTEDLANLAHRRRLSEADFARMRSKAAVIGQLAEDAAKR